MHFNPDLEIIVISDASDYGIGAVICHKFKGGKIKTVASRALIATDKKYS